MNYTTEHQNFIIISKFSMIEYLETENIWHELIKSLTPFIKPIKGVCNITANQFVKNGDAIKLGRLTWNHEVLHKLIDNYNNCTEKNKFTFNYFSGYFPNLTTCVKFNVTPKITLIINDGCEDEKVYGSGFFISFRNDYYEEIGETRIIDMIDNISVLLKSVLRLKLKRIYARQTSENWWTDSLQDLFPTSAVKIKDNNLIIDEKFEHWQQF
jgi:hypothetical protein